MSLSVYIETTVVSYLAARNTRDLIRAAQQQLTREWWRDHRLQFDVYTSELVLIEASAGDPEAAAERLRVLSDLPLLDVSDRALELADRLIAAAALPVTAARDAQHVGIAAANGMEFLLTWNCRHLANAVLRDKIEQVCDESGLIAPKICTPDELTGELP